MYTYRDIRKVHLELTQKCQAACPMCDRNTDHGTVNPHLTDAELSLSDIQQIFPPELIAQLTEISLCGNFGDPIFATDMLEICQYFRLHNSNLWISINTNGGARQENWWAELAKVLGWKGRVIFSIDGLEDTNHIYRQNVVWKNVEKSVKAFTSAGGKARWDFIVFGHNEHQINDAKTMSISWGMDHFVTKKTARFFSTSKNEGKDKHIIENRKGNTVILTKPSEANQNSALKTETKLVEQHGSMKAFLDSAEIKCKVKDEGNIYITAEGHLMPCCWTAIRMYRWWHKVPKKEQIWKFIENSGGISTIDLRKISLEQALNNQLFNNIEKSWNGIDIKTDKLEVCAQKCSIGFDTFKEQYK